MCVFTSWTIFCRCFCLRCCLRCWHSNTNYTWNITPTYKTHYYPTWGGIHADVCSALLFPLTHSPLHTPRRHHWPTLTLRRLLHCLSLTNAAVCLVLSLYLSAPPISRDIYFIYIFQCSGFRENSSVHTESIPRGNHWLALNSAIITPPLALHCRPESDPRQVILLILHWFGM